MACWFVHLCLCANKNPEHNAELAARHGQGTDKFVFCGSGSFDRAAKVWQGKTHHQERERHGTTEFSLGFGFAHPSLGCRKERAMLRLQHVSSPNRYLQRNPPIYLPCLFTQGASPFPGCNFIAVWVLAYEMCLCLCRGELPQTT